MLARKAWQRVCAKIRRRFYFDQWLVMYAFGKEMSGSFRHFKHILPPRDRFWADPFVVRHGESYCIFVEELIYQRDKGHISVIAMDGQGGYASPTTVIDEQHHLSYPFVFSYEGEQYMLAEACAAEVVPLYRCEEFPHKWTFERNILYGVSALDPTVFQHGDKWYLFVGIVENPGASTWDELFLYFADDPISGNWQPHPLNPVVSDVRRARPAGRIFEHNGNIYRPSQNSIHHYGYGLNVNRITKLSQTEYEEELVSSIEPKWSNKITSIHTLSYTHGLTAVDAQIRRARYW
ncbi:MAG: glucosamine inositolphosphorylceramide transferase family protein [Woeseiaceae bacterium]